MASPSQATYTKHDHRSTRFGAALWCPVSVSVLYFASARDAAQGVEREVVEIGSPQQQQPATLESALSIVVSRHPALEPILVTAMISVNEEYSDAENTALVALKDGDEVAIIPPVSGG
ncbi:hypothetical protein GQ54DRAFT_312659 [Martensiomyces pterosporus]|nr:hypothetical protein GQ54DRAFT_312659 [Martensiomyces pterosporus]